MRKHVVEVEDLVKRYKKSESNAVDGVNFYVEPGTLFSLLGPNGAGKTTTISVLTTILSKTSGEVRIDGLDVEKEASKVRQRIGVLFQNPSLDVNLTAEENIRFHANLYGLYTYRPTFGMMSKEYQDRVMRLAEVLELERDIHKSVKALSGGMKRKLEIVRSLMHEPKVLFLDEPTTGLDPVSRNNLWKYLQGIRKREKTTIFLTTHYLEEAEASDYVCIINHGKVVAKGTPNEIKESLIEEYVLMDAQDRDKLKKELKKFKIKGNGPFRVETNGVSSQEVISSVKSELTTLRIHNPTLEQAYLRIISQEKK